MSSDLVTEKRAGLGVYFKILDHPLVSLGKSFLPSSQDGLPLGDGRC